MPEVEAGTPFAGHMRVLQERRTYLLRCLEENPGDPHVQYWAPEAKALDWAIDALQGTLTFPPDVDEMRRAWAARTRAFKEFDREFAQFMDYLEWSEARAAQERKWDHLV